MFARHILARAMAACVAAWSEDYRKDIARDVPPAVIIHCGNDRRMLQVSECRSQLAHAIHSAA
jgi:hypothetical protein